MKTRPAVQFQLSFPCSADGMLFGPLGQCPLCASPMEYKEGHYCCRGFLSEWTKCTHTTQEAPRLKAQWKLPEDNDNEYLDEVGIDNSAGLPHGFVLRPSCFGDVSAGNLPKDSKSKFLNDAGVHSLNLVFLPCLVHAPLNVKSIVDESRMTTSTSRWASLKSGLSSPLSSLDLCIE